MGDHLRDPTEVDRLGRSGAKRRRVRTPKGPTAKISMMDYKAAFEKAVDQVKDEGRYRVFADLKRYRGDFPRACWTRDDGSQRDVVVWCSNDYIGQGQNPVVIEAMHRAIDEAGTGSGGTRNISGTTHYHVQLEQELARLHAKAAERPRWPGPRRPCRIPATRRLPAACRS